MSYKVANTLPIRRVRRMMQRAVGGTHRMASSAPIVSKPMRVAIRPHPSVEVGEELLILAALREIKTQHDKINLVYASPHQEIVDLLKGNWFLHDVFLCGSSDFFEEYVVKDGYGITAFEPDPEAAGIAEKAKYDGRYNIELQAKQELQEGYDKAGMKDLKVEMPAYNFIPRWHKTNAYMWSIADKVGIEVDVPFGSIPPYGETNKGIRSKANPRIAKSHITDRDFFVYDFRGEPSELLLAGIAEKALAGMTPVSIQTIEKAVGEDVGSLLTVLSSNNCKFVIAPVGTLLYAAWGAGIEDILNLYTGGNPTWDGASTNNCYPMGRDKCDDETLPVAIYQAIQYIRERERQGVA